MYDTNTSTFGIPATSASNTEVIGVSTLNQLNHDGLEDPMEIDGLTATALKNAKPSAINIYNLREEIQRAFNKARKDNVASYATYLSELAAGNIRGAFPPVTLFTDSPAEFDEETRTLRLPFNATIIAIDGETQTAARFMLFGNQPESGDWPVKFTLHFGINIDAAKKIVHDLNHEGQKIKESEVASLNVDGAVTKLINASVTDAGFSLSDINRRADGMGSKFNPFVSTFKRLQAFATGAHYNDKDPKATPETFLKLHNGLDHLAINDEELIKAGIGKLVGLPWETGKKVNQTVARALGILVSRHHTADVVNVQNVENIFDKLLTFKGTRGIVRHVEAIKGM